MHQATVDEQERREAAAVKLRMTSTPFELSGFREVESFGVARGISVRSHCQAERFIRTLLAEWAYAQSYRTRLARTHALTRYLGYYNVARPHMGIRGQTPQQKLATL